MADSVLLPSLPPSLAHQLKTKTNEVLSKFIRANYHTQYGQTASELSGFRDATFSLLDEMDDDTLSETFRKTVLLTTYESYGPLLAKFYENPCKASAVTNLLAPGLPDFLARSTSTSGSAPKWGPKYDYVSENTPSSCDWWTVSDPLRKSTTAHIAHLWCKPLTIMDDNDDPVKTVYISSTSATTYRKQYQLHPAKDEERMALFMPNHAAPYAASFIQKYHSFLLIHALFALASTSLERIRIAYTSTFVDMMRLIDAEFDLVVDSIAKGTIPDIGGIAELRCYLEENILPNPERAADLRSLGPPSSRPGWCGYAWPKMHSIRTTASGSFATYLPLAQWFLGPNIDVTPRGYGSTEGSLTALPYNPRELNQYRPVSNIIMEFLDVSQNETINALVQPWEAVSGRRYELVLTTEGGFWRYRIGDVVEICGFDSTDGVPIIQIIKRANVAIRLHSTMVTEEDLNAAISNMTTKCAVQILGWSSMIDYRSSPPTVGFLIELSGDQGLDLTQAPLQAFEALSRSNQRLAFAAAECGSFRTPTVRLVSPGTFSEFLHLKVEQTGSSSIAQMKIPVVLSKAEHVSWFLSRVVREL